MVTAKRDKAAALKFLKRIMKKYGQPRSVVTEGLCSYPVAMKEIGNADGVVKVTGYRASLLVNLPGDEMPLLIEMILDLGLN